MRCHCVPFGPFRFHLGNKQRHSGIDFLLLASAQYNSFLRIKYLCPVQYFWKNTMMKVKLCKVYMLECQQGDEICFRYNKIHQFDTLERQTMGVNKYASTFPMPSCNMTTCNHRKKRGLKKYLKKRNCFCMNAIEDNTQMTQKLI